MSFSPVSVNEDEEYVCRSGIVVFAGLVRSGHWFSIVFGGEVCVVFYDEKGASGVGGYFCFLGVEFCG